MVEHTFEAPARPRSDWHALSTPRGGFVLSESLAATGHVRHGVTTRQADMNLSFRTEPDADRVRANREKAAALFFATLDDLTVPEQIHAAGVAAISAAERGRGGATKDDTIPGADALVTNVPGVLLGVTVADCVPVFLLDTAHRAIGLAHSGWRGTAGGIAPKTLERMRAIYGTEPKDVLVGIGPAIGGACYEVGEEVREAFSQAGIEGSVFQHSPAGRWLLNLRAAISSQLLASGVPVAAISVAPWCTHCAADLFYSHRCDGAQAGRMGALITLV